MDYNRSTRRIESLNRGTQGMGWSMQACLAAGSGRQLKVRGRAQFLQVSLFTIDALDKLKQLISRW